jgi:4-alpha-glucanotransferase
LTDKPSRGRPRPSDWGVQTEYIDAAGKRRRLAQRDVDALMVAMGAGELDAVPDAGPVFARPGARVDGKALRLEAGGEVALSGSLPEDVPFGYHRLLREDDQEVTLVVSPGRCHLPEDLRGWGWAAQLYAVRSARSWGMGDLGDLRRLARWAAQQQATMMLLNPLHAPLPVLPQQPSPYYPSTRRYRNPLYLRVEDVPGAGELADIEELSIAGQRLNEDDRIERDRVFALKMEALGRIWLKFAGNRDFDAYRKREGESLSAYALFCAISEAHGTGFSRWPEEFRRPDSAAVAAFAGEHQRGIEFHMWLQWLIDRQLRGAAKTIPLVHDMAVGFAPDGADAWLWQDLLAGGISVGAPPDAFNPGGQDWGLPAF